MSPAPLWTSTQFQNWKTDCTKYMATQQPFEVQDVYRPEHELFCANQCESHHYTVVMQKHIAVCTPEASN